MGYISWLIILLVNLGFSRSFQNCKCLTNYFYCSRNTLSIDSCLDHSKPELGSCNYIWSKSELRSIGEEFSSCFNITSCSKPNATLICFCDVTNDHNEKSQVPNNRGFHNSCAHYYRDNVSRYLECICKSSNKIVTLKSVGNKQQLEENSHKAVLIVLVFLFIVLVTLACMISCHSRLYRYELSLRI